MTSGARPDFSLFGMANRPYLWADFHAALARNRASFEVIFCGPRPPEGEMPSNFRWVESAFKPAQCAEIASRYATGRLVSYTVDDLRYSPGALDRILDVWHILDGARIVTPTYLLDGEDLSECMRFNYPGAPYLPLGGFLSLEQLRGLGGIDRRFTATQWDVDLFMRAHVAGLDSIRLADVVAEERREFHRREESGESLSERYHAAVDRPLLEWLWPVPIPGRPWRRRDAPQAYPDGPEVEEREL